MPDLNPYALPALDGTRASALLAEAMNLVPVALGTSHTTEASRWLKEAAAYLWWLDRKRVRQALGSAFDPTRVYGICELCHHKHGAEPCGTPLGDRPYKTCVCPLGN